MVLERHTARSTVDNSFPAFDLSYFHASSKPVGCTCLVFHGWELCQYVVLPFLAIVKRMGEAENGLLAPGRLVLTCFSASSFLGLAMLTGSCSFLAADTLMFFYCAHGAPAPQHTCHCRWG